MPSKLKWSFYSQDISVDSQLKNRICLLRPQPRWFAIRLRGKANKVEAPTLINQIGIAGNGAGSDQRNDSNCELVENEFKGFALLHSSYSSIRCAASHHQTLHWVLKIDLILLLLDFRGSIMLITDIIWWKDPSIIVNYWSWSYNDLIIFVKISILDI